MRVCAPNGRWRIAWAEGLATREEPVAETFLKSFLFSTLHMSFIIDNADCLKAIAAMLRNPRYGPIIDGYLVEYIYQWYRHERYSYWLKPVVRMLLEEPRVRAWALAMPGQKEDWLYVRPDALIIADTWKAVRRCRRIKEELIERTWHPDRVWNWCFDEDEKREIGVA